MRQNKYKIISNIVFFYRTFFLFSIKYIGIYTSFVCTYLIAQDFWRLLPKKSISDWKLVLDFVVSIDTFLSLY